jgi:hypothetical protein
VGEPHVLTVKLVDDFQKKGRWVTVLKTLEDNADSPVPVKLPFRVVEGLIYTVLEGKLYVPETVQPDVLRLAHDEPRHAGPERTLHHLNGVTFTRARHHTKVYIDHYIECSK